MSKIKGVSDTQSIIIILGLKYQCFFPYPIDFMEKIKVGRVRNVWNVHIEKVGKWKL